MKVYLESGDAPRPQKGSQNTTRSSSRSGGFKPSKPGRETYDGQGFGGAGRRKATPKKNQDEEESRGVDISVDEETEYNLSGEEAGAEEETSEEATGYEDEGEQEEEPEEPPRGRAPSKQRRRMSDAEMTEEEFEAYQASKRKKGRQPKGKKEPKGKKGQSQAITLGKNAGSAGKKAKPPKESAKPAKEPKSAGKKQQGMSINMGSKSMGKSAGKPSSKPMRQAEDDFDEMFGNEQPKESVVSQLITIVEVVIGAGLSFFGASQLGYILINKIMTGG